MTVNVPLLRKTLEYVESHPEEWDQSTWICGSAGCFAWHAAMIDGAEPLTANPEYVRADNDDPPDKVHPADGDAYPVDHIHVAARAARVLGFGPELPALFRASNTLDDLRRIVGRLTAEEERRGS